MSRSPVVAWVTDIVSSEVSDVIQALHVGIPLIRLETLNLIAELEHALQVPPRHTCEDCLIICASVRVTKRMPRLQVRVRSKFSVNELSVRVIFLHRLHSLLVASCPFIRSFQSIPDVVVLHDPMVLPLEQARSKQDSWQLPGSA
jgi:hypothetical protein